MMRIDLTWEEVSFACIVAQRRRLSNAMRGNKAGHAGDHNFFLGMNLDVKGCLGEYAVAKALNLHWSGLAYTRAPDVGGMIEVRAIDDARKRLILHPEDDDALMAVLALVPDNDVRAIELRGWISVKDGKNPAYWSDPNTGRPAFFIPHSALLPMESLRDQIRRAA